jgi:diguanylate cyclase (GGDEF)-like protein
MQMVARAEQPNIDETTVDPWGSFEPYAQLVRSSLPRASSVALYDSAAKLRWSSETSTGPDLQNLVETALEAGGANQDAGQMRLLDGTVPVYLCCLRDELERLIGVLVVVCRQYGDPGSEARSFAVAHSLLRPALECLRRELLSRIALDQSQRTVRSRDRELELLLGDGTADRPPGDGADELKGILQQAIEHVGSSMATLIVPDKSIALLRSKTQRSSDTQFVARARRQLLSLAQTRREPIIINQLAPNSVMGILPYKILSCPLHSAVGKTIGVLALFREDLGNPFSDRDARLTAILARKAVGVIESSYDALSGLYTRPAFERRIRAVVDAGAVRHWTALYIDADQLHVINDSLGMHVGDSVLGQLGELILQRLPPGAFAARISGDRFAVLLPTQLDAAEEFAESLRAGVEQLGRVGGESPLHLSISIGVALLDTAAGEVMHSLAAAETACKAAKDRGRNRVEVYQANDASLVRRFADINIVGQLRAAIDADRLWLAAQLIVPLAKVETPGSPHFELLLRMVDEDGGSVGPDRFLSAANRYQLMPEIDRWVISKTIELLKPHSELLAGSSMSFAVNFSGQSLKDEDFVDFVLERVGSSGLDPRRFCFELTENATIANITRAESLIRSLRQLGCGVALDDFGTGLSSLAYLRQLPVSMLKIDGSFVRDILKDPRAESLVLAIAQLARSMSIVTVAEYVETEEIRALVTKLGVDYGQGFAIGKPRPFVDVLAELPGLVAAGA